MKAKFDICCYVSWITGQDSGKTAADAEQTATHLHKCEFICWFLSWLVCCFHWPVCFRSLRGSHQIMGLQATGKHTLPQRSPFPTGVLWGITNVCLMNGKLKQKKGEMLWRQSGGHIEGSSNIAAIQIGCSQWGLLGCSSPLKVLHSLNLSHIQSLRWRIHRETWKKERSN